MLKKPFTVLNLLDLELSDHDSLHLRCIGGRKGLSNTISVPDINRPGLALTGFFDSFSYGSVQLFGRSENAYLKKLHSENNTKHLEEMFQFDIPCVVFSRRMYPDDIFMDIFEKAECAVLQTDLESNEFSTRLFRVFSNIFAPKKIIHGVLVEVYGIGVLIKGSSGIGKSECALELIERGHRLVADDVIEIRCVNGNSIIGNGANALMGHHMEIRGLGIINIARMYGVSSICERKEIQLVILLEEWNEEKVYDRVGLDMKTDENLGVQIPAIEIPVKPGRNIPILIEAATMNARLKFRGYDYAKDFKQNVLRWIETDEIQAAYYGSDDSY